MVHEDNVLCPFFIEQQTSSKNVPRSVRERLILCRSVLPTATHSRETFQTKELRVQHQRIFCEGCYDRCEKYVSIMHWQWPEE